MENESVLNIGGCENATDGDLLLPQMQRGDMGKEKGFSVLSLWETPQKGSRRRTIYRQEGEGIPSDPPPSEGLVKRGRKPMKDVSQCEWCLKWISEP